MPVIIIDQLHGLASLAHSIVGGIRLQEVVVELPVDAWTRRVEHPLDDASGMWPTHTE